jgi:hypothetical protein
MKLVGIVVLNNEVVEDDADRRQRCCSRTGLHPIALPATPS